MAFPAILAWRDDAIGTSEDNSFHSRGNIVVIATLRHYLRLFVPLKFRSLHRSSEALESLAVLARQSQASRATFIENGVPHLELGRRQNALAGCGGMHVPANRSFKE